MKRCQEPFTAHGDHRVGCKPLLSPEGHGVKTFRLAAVEATGRCVLGSFGRPRSPFRVMQKAVLIFSLFLVADGNLNLPAFATELEQRFDDLAYLEFHVGEVMASRCSERFPEYWARFDRALTTWSSTYRDRINRSRRLSQKAAEQGKANLEADIAQRAQASQQAFQKMEEPEVRSRCEAILNELRIEK